MRYLTRLTICLAAIAGIWLALAGTAHAAGEESCFTAKINGARSASGRAPLTTRSDLVSIARRHSSRMASSGTIFHNGNLANEAPSDWQSIGENVGMGPTCDEIHTAFMNSASHRRNILDPDFNYVGVGVVISGDGTIFVTEVFMQAPSGSATGTTAPATTSRPRSTTPRRPAAPRAPPPPPPAPPPPPPPPPGSKVTGETAAYFDLLEKESEPPEDVITSYEAYKRLLEAEKRREEQRKADRKRADRSLLTRVSSFIGGVLSAGI